VAVPDFKLTKFPKLRKFLDAFNKKIATKSGTDFTSTTAFAFQKKSNLASLPLIPQLFAFS
jgi:hypothetical protein